MAYRRGIVVIDSKKVNLDTIEELYGDGRFRGSRGVSLNVTEKGNLVWEAWTNWQGESDSYRFVTADEAKELLEQHPHPERAGRAIIELEKRGLVKIEEA